MKMMMMMFQSFFNVLFSAPKCISAPAVEDNFEVLDNGPEPCGIYVCDGPCLPSTFKVS